MSDSSGLKGNFPQRNFATTHWSMVLAVGDGSSTTSKSALEKLCESYWYPLYSFVRRKGFDANGAADLTQGFFASLIERNDFETIRKEKGRFRSFLLAAIRHFIANEMDHANAAKRGGNVSTFSIDANSAESKYKNELNEFEPSHEVTPENSFERTWAIAMIENVHSLLRVEFVKNGRETLFDRLQIFLTGSNQQNAPTYRELAEEFEISESAIKVNVHRMRQQFRELLRAEIAHTVPSESEIDDELKALFVTLSGPSR